MVNISKLDFSGQHLYVGLDVHKKHLSVCILTQQFEHKTFTHPPDPSVNPADIPTWDKERADITDKVDCRKLACCLRNGELQGIYVPTRLKIEDRSLLRIRRNMVKKQTQCNNQIKSLLSFYGSHIPTNNVHRNWSSKFIHWIKDIRMEKASGNFVLRCIFMS